MNRGSLKERTHFRKGRIGSSDGLVYFLIFHKHAIFLTSREHLKAPGEHFTEDRACSLRVDGQLMCKLSDLFLEAVFITLAVSALWQVILYR